MTDASLTIPRYLIKRLAEHGVYQGFGIVGDYALRLFADLDEGGFPILVTADEQGAVFAADAFARLRGLGVVAVTYGVGGLKIANGVAGAWAEQVPLLVISGAPGVKESSDDVLLHHRIKGFDTQIRVIEDLTIAQAQLTNPLTAADEIDRVIADILSHQRPGYIEIPRDMVEGEIAPPSRHQHRTLPKVDQGNLEAAVSDAIQSLRGSSNPVVQIGVMALRRGLGPFLVEAAEMMSARVATSSLSKGAFPERHPLSLGVYMGAVSPADVVERIENASTIISLGVLNTDLTMGGFTAKRSKDHLIDATDRDVTIGHRTYKHVPLWAFVPALVEAASKQSYHGDPEPARPRPGFTPEPGHVLSVARVIAAVDTYLDERHGLLVDPGECLFASVDLMAPNWCLASAYYATMGYAVPAALGAGIAQPELRPVVLVGDGAFAMTGLEAGWAAFHGVTPIIVVLDNNGYGTQRPMKDGPFNDIAPLKAERLPEVFGTGKGWLATTEDELDRALAEAVEFDGLAMIRVVVPQGDTSPALTRLTQALAKRV